LIRLAQPEIVAGVWRVIGAAQCGQKVVAGDNFQN
jgi:hypothetical protein